MGCVLLVLFAVNYIVRSIWNIMDLLFLVSSYSATIRKQFAIYRNKKLPSKKFSIFKGLPAGNKIVYVLKTFTFIRLFKFLRKKNKKMRKRTQNQEFIFYFSLYNTYFSIVVQILDRNESTFFSFYKYCHIPSLIMARLYFMSIWVR